jgi:peroxiredoxin/outer membrane lipoprotein-sorting protein
LWPVALFLLIALSAGAQNRSERPLQREADPLQSTTSGAPQRSLISPQESRTIERKAQRATAPQINLRDIMDARTEVVMNKWAEAYLNTDELKYTSVATYASSNPREKPRKITIHFSGCKPNLMRAEVITPDAQENGVMISDGRTIWEYCRELNIYATTPVPDGAFLMQGELHGLRYVPASMLFHPEPFRALVEDARNIRLLGTEKVGKEKCYKLSRQLSRGISVTWISTEDYLPRLTVRYDMRGGRPVEVYREERTEVAVNTRAPASTYRFRPPPRTKRHIFPRPEDALLEPGTETPYFTVQDINNAPARLVSLRGRTVVLLFWSVYCPTCRAEMLELNKIQAEFARRGVVVVAISGGDYPDDIRDYYKENPDTRVTLWRDPTARREKSSPFLSFGARGIPTTYVLDAEGKVVSAWSGYDDKKAEELRDTLRRVTTR